MENNYSKNLMKLNQDYLQLYYSSSYQKHLNKKIRKLSIKDMLFQIYTGYFYHRIKSMFFLDNKKYYPTCSNNGKVNLENQRIAVYTVIIGDYDDLKEPLFYSENCDYYVITDKLNIDEESIWKKIMIADYINVEEFSNTEIARYVKTHPHIFFKEYSYSLFIDGNFLIVADIMPLFSGFSSKFLGLHIHPSNECIYKEGNDVIALRKSNLTDVKTQLNYYRKQGFPKNYGLFETNIMIRKHNDKECIKIMEEWWNQMKQYTKRDQLSLTYVLWKLGYSFNDIYILGNNPRLNPRFRYLSHKNVN